MTSTSHAGHAVRQRASRKRIPCETVSTRAARADPRLMCFAGPGIEWHPESGTRRPATSAHIVCSALDLSEARAPADLLGFGEPVTPTRASADGSIWAAPWAVPAAGEQTVLVQTSYGLVPIGWVRSALRVLDDAPNQREGAPRAWIRFDEQVAEGAKDLRPGDEIVVLTWLHLSPRDELSTHPEDDMSQPLTGVFSTCSPNRPNPIGLHRARIVARDGPRIEVRRSGGNRRDAGGGRQASHRPARMTRGTRRVLYGDLSARNRTSR